MPYKNKEAQAAAAKRHYEKNKSSMVARAVANNKAARVNHKAYIQTYLLTHPCIDCGETDPVVLEFDHVTGIKKANIADLTRCSYSLETLEKEIAKCEVRCANCHRRVTHERRNIAG